MLKRIVVTVVETQVWGGGGGGGGGGGRGREIPSLTISTIELLQEDYKTPRTFSRKRSHW